jgi:hypothetical protein
MANSKLREFTIYGWVQVLTDVKVRAASFEEAAQEASKLKETDFVTLAGDFMDGAVVIEGIYDNNSRSRLEK